MTNTKNRTPAQRVADSRARTIAAECTDARDGEHSDAVRQAVIAYIRSGGEIEE